MGNATLTSTLPLPLCTPLLVRDDVILKPEWGQRSGSVKYRLVHSRVKAALEAGQIHSKITLVEVSAGSTGLALAYAGQVLGLRVEIHVHDAVSPEKALRMSEYGAKVVMHSSDTPIPVMLSLVRRLVETERYWHLGQYDRGSFAEAYTPFAREIVEQIYQLDAPLPSHLVCPVGTGGLIQGVGSCLREVFPGIRVIAVEPDPDAEIDGIRNTERYHMGDKDPYDRTFPDERITVPAPEENARIDGIRMGASATAAYRLIRDRGWNNALMIAPD